MKDVFVHFNINDKDALDGLSCFERAYMYRPDDPYEWGALKAGGIRIRFIADVKSEMVRKDRIVRHDDGRSR